MFWVSSGDAVVPRCAACASRFTFGDGGRKQCERCDWEGNETWIETVIGSGSRGRGREENGVVVLYDMRT